jgi:hypothetical protein
LSRAFFLARGVKIRIDDGSSDSRASCGIR